MNNNHRVIKLSLIYLMIVIALSAWLGSNHSALAGELSGVIPPKWTRDLPADPCPGTSNTYCHYGSPVLAHIDGDNFLDIVAVTN